MAKKVFGIADAIRNEVKTPVPTAPVTVKKEQKTTAPAVAEASKRGRPRKDESRDEFVRAAVPTALKKKLHIICTQKKITESDYTYELLKKAIARDFEEAFSAIQDV